MKLSDLAQELMNRGCEYGQSKNNLWWIWWGDRRVFLIQCRDCQEWLKSPKKTGLCGKCRGGKYNRSEYHRKRRESLLKGANFSCVVCGLEFSATRKTKKTCSDSCRKKLSRNPERYPSSAIPQWTEKDSRDLNYFDRAFMENTRDIVRGELRGAISKERAGELWDTAWEKFGAKAQNLRNKKNYLDSI